jgi:hypothetical protein
MGISPRLRRRIDREFREPGSAKGIEGLLTNVVESLHGSHWGSDEVERIQAAILIRGNGDLARIRDMRDLALQDWRDASRRLTWPMRIGLTAWTPNWDGPRR